jgi:hypothetical protein
LETDAADDAVECYSGHTYAGEPRAVRWQGERRLVTRVLDRRRTPAGPAFRVEVEGGVHLDLQYNEATGRWSVREYR